MATKLTKLTTASQTTMCYVIAYDIPDDRRRTKIHKILTGFGNWTQYSLFECFLSKKELILLKSKLAPYLEDTEDSVRFYPLCAACVEKVETVGGEPPKEDEVYIV
jgi:CRISPR-associated protein Cas2